MDFLNALSQHAFLQNALIAGIAVSIAGGVVGSYVVVRRITYIAGGIAHCVLGGMGAARYGAVRFGWDWLDPIYGAVLAAIAAALIIGLVSLRAREREDTVIGAVWAIGMAVGVLFIARTPGYEQDLMGYLFGNILMVSGRTLWLIALLDVIVIGVTLLCYRPFLAVCYDEEFARLRGVNVEAYYLLLLCMTAVAVVLLVSVVGIVLVIALLTLPVAIASHMAARLGTMMLIAAGLSALFTTAGLALSYEADLKSGATTIVIAGAAYLVVILGKRLRRG
jgi:zinc transport system permease protein